MRRSDDIGGTGLAGGMITSSYAYERVINALIILER